MLLLMMLRFRAMQGLSEGMMIRTCQVAHARHIVEQQESGKLDHCLQCIVELPLECQVGLGENEMAIK